MTHTFEKMSPSYLKNHHSLAKGADSSKRLFLVDLLTPLLPSNKDARILEIGPGNGEALALLTKEFKFRYVEAIDIAADVIDACRHLPDVNLHLVSDAAEFLNDRRDYFDAILMYHVLEHFSKNDVVPMLAACRLALRNGGIMIVGVPNVGAPLIGPEQQFSDFTHQTAFSPSSLVQAHKMAGFTNVIVSEAYPPRGGIRRIAQRWLQKLLMVPVRLYMFIMAPYRNRILTHNMICVSRI